MKPKTIRQLFDELADDVSPDLRSQFERLGRRLEHLSPDDEILLLLWYVAIHTKLEINERKLVANLVVKLENSNTVLISNNVQTQKWARLLFYLFIGQAILLGIFVGFFELLVRSLGN